jgi:hypothetical protein
MHLDSIPVIEIEMFEILMSCLIRCRFTLNVQSEAKSAILPADFRDAKTTQIIRF